KQSSQTSPKTRIIAAIPCFNEGRFIGSVVVKTKKYVDRVIVIDDGSADDSAEIAEATGATVYRHTRNQGYGAAINSALEKGKELRADVLVIIDGDGQHDPKDIPSLVKPILDGEADVVVGSRFLGKENKSPFYRRLGQRVLTTATNISAGHKISDSQSGCRAYSSKALQKLNLTEQGMSVSSEIQFAIERSGLRVAEVPIDVSYEDKAKRNPIVHGVNVLTRITVLFSLKQPFLLFGVPGISLIISGLIIGIGVIKIYSNTNQLALGNALGAILFCIAGLLGVFTALMLQAMKELLRGEASHLVKRMKGSTLDPKDILD
ncbi:MAG: glycosyltransferase family 2 protein, partial [Chloroflexota bacterium]|nr:glycosyltransferase family 2 protein [Chloroflexota bacterium]